MMNKKDINTLKERSERCVCKMCGSKLEMRIIIHNQYGGEELDLFCPKCSRVEYGTEPQIYNLAKEFVEKFEFNYYVDMIEDEHNIQLNRGKICDIAAWIIKNYKQ